MNEKTTLCLYVFLHLTMLLKMDALEIFLLDGMVGNGDNFQLNNCIDRRIESNFPCYMMTSSNGNIFRVTGPLCGEFAGPRWIPARRPVTRSFDVFFELRPNKRLSKQSWGWWFETLSCSLWRHCNDYSVTWAHLHGNAKDEFTLIIDPKLCVCESERWYIWFNSFTANNDYINCCELHKPRIFYPSGHWPETVTNAHVSAHFH